MCRQPAGLPMMVSTVGSIVFGFVLGSSSARFSFSREGDMFFLFAAVLYSILVLVAGLVLEGSHPFFWGFNIVVCLVGIVLGIKRMV